MVRSLSRFTWTLLCSLFLFAQTPNLARAASWSTNDLKTGTPLPSGTVTINNVSVGWQVGNYMSGSLRIFGLVCAPTSLSGPRPVAILNHGLAVVSIGAIPFLPAIEASGWKGCTNLAAAGWLAAISTYRGEIIGSVVGGGLPAPYQTWFGVSDGGLELCFGEVDDVLNLLSAVTALPNADSSHVLMWGHSHGSCITERAIERGAPVQIAVSIDGPTDFTTWSGANPIIVPTLAAQQARSTVYASNDPSALGNRQFLRIHAEGDTVVPPTQACELAAKLPTSANYYLYSGTSPPGVYWGSPKECSAFQLTWQKGHLLPDERPNLTWSSLTFLMYSRLDHIAIVSRAWPEAASFVNQTTKAKNWGALFPAAYTPMEN